MVERAVDQIFRYECQCDNELLRIKGGGECSG